MYRTDAPAGRRCSPPSHDVFADVALAPRLGGQGAVGQYNAHPAAGGQVVDHVLDPGKVGVAGRGQAVLPANVVLELLRAPAREIEGRVGHDVIGPQGGVEVGQEGVGGILAQVRFDAADGKVHLGQLPGGGVGVLAIDRDILNIAAVVLDEFGRLDKHTARAAAGVVHPPAEGLEHLHQSPNHARRREELAAPLALLLGKHGQTVFIGAAQNILLAAAVDHLDVGEQVHYIPQAALVQLGPGKIFRQDVLQARILLLDGPHGVVDHQADFGAVGLGGDLLPPCPLRDVEYPLGKVLVLVIFEAVALSYQLLVLILKAVRDVFQKNQPQDHALVFRCVQVAAQNAGGVPDLLFKPNIGGVFLCHGVNLRLFRSQSIL